jgi:hypothetical protein
MAHILVGGRIILKWMLGVEDTGLWNFIVLARVKTIMKFGFNKCLEPFTS